MSKKLYISEKPSVAQEFAKALKLQPRKHDGYLETEEAIITWCVGHLVTMSYPEVYDASLKKWSLRTLPFLPKQFKYEVIPNVKKQFQVVKGLLNREDVDVIYVCTDSGREGEYIYRLVSQMAKVPTNKEQRRVWIDSQTEEEILRGIKEAKSLSEYDNLSSAAYLRAKEDYLMGINFSRVLSLTYGQAINDFVASQKWSAISVGRVMTCVLGMVVRREREVRTFVKTPFYRVLGSFLMNEKEYSGEWKAVEGSKYYQSMNLYKENGFKERIYAEKLVEELSQPEFATGIVDGVEKKKEKKNPPLLFNLAELQNSCSKLFKISPDETLRVVQELYEKKMVTYPRTDARVLSTAVCKEIHKNLQGLKNYIHGSEYAKEILEKGSYQGLSKTRYVNDKQITDHYAIIPTGQGISTLSQVSSTSQKVYEIIVRRFLSIFYPAAEYQKVNIISKIGVEKFFTSTKVLLNPGYLKVATFSFAKKEEEKGTDHENEEETNLDEQLIQMIQSIRKGATFEVKELSIKEGETSPPKRYNSGSLILAMESAGQLIEDEELRAQIKGNGIGTSATRAEILNKLVKITYLSLNKKTQIIMPTLQGELIFEVVNTSIKSLLNPDLTASWEKGLTYVSDGKITEEEYMQKLEGFVTRMVDGVKKSNNNQMLKRNFDQLALHYSKKA